jgi:hypothetical protein
MLAFPCLGIAKVPCAQKTIVTVLWPEIAEAIYFVADPNLAWVI